MPKDNDENMWNKDAYYKDDIYGNIMDSRNYKEDKPNALETYGPLVVSLFAMGAPALAAAAGAGAAGLGATSAVTGAAAGLSAASIPTGLTAAGTALTTSQALALAKLPKTVGGFIESKGRNWQSLALQAATSLIPGGSNLSRAYQAYQLFGNFERSKFNSLPDLPPPPPSPPSSENSL